VQQITNTAAHYSELKKQKKLKNSASLRAPLAGLDLAPSGLRTPGHFPQEEMTRPAKKRTTPKAIGSAHSLGLFPPSGCDQVNVQSFAKSKRTPLRCALRLLASILPLRACYRPAISLKRK
jgi:hypothetical protein